MKYEISQKAWVINFNKINEAYLYDLSETVVYAESRNKAKSALMQKSYVLEMELLSGDEMNYITVPIQRAPEYDLLLYKGESLSLWQINEKIAQEERKKYFNKINDDDAITHCYIMKRGCYYQSGYSGYTDFKQFAGVYPKKDAIRHSIGCDEITLVPINNLDHNEIITKAIKKLSVNYINTPNYVNLIAMESDRFDWSLLTFPEATPESSIRKLQSETGEILTNIKAGVKDPFEYADALMCLLDAAGREGITVLEILKAFSEKLEINKNREWIKNPDNSYSHKKPN